MAVALVRNPHHGHSQLVAVPVLHVASFWVLDWPGVPDVHGCFFTGFRVLDLVQARHVDDLFSLEERNLGAAVAFNDLLGN